MPNRVVVVAVALALTLSLLACTHPVRARFPSDPAEPTGSVILAFTKPASDVIVAVNGVLVVDGEDTDRVQIDGIPTGRAELAIAAGPGQQQIEVWVDGENTRTIPLGFPGQSGGDTIKGILSSIAGILVYALLFR